VRPVSTGETGETGAAGRGTALLPDLAPLLCSNPASRGFRLGLYAALACLAAAGAADMISGIFRATLWNQTIPDALRGRLAGVELLSYGVGPPVGQLRSGVVASLAGTRVSLVSGGLFCLGGVAAVCGLLPAFVRYKSEPA
jgi:hypothetical protein